MLLYVNAASMCLQPAVLVLCWHLRAAEACYFTKDEFINGLEQLRVDSVDKLAAKFASFRSDLNDEDKFRQIYEYAFVYSKESDKRSLAIEMATAMMRLLLSSKYPLVEEFLTYVEVYFPLASVCVCVCVCLMLPWILTDMQCACVVAKNMQGIES
jgi:hypothetical protein